MISDFPTQDDFFTSAEGYLNSSWREVIELLTEFDEVKDVIDDSPYANEALHYWRSAKQTLISATALVQQAVEFYIKGRIVSVSPFLLISSSPSSWPKGCHRNNIPFSSFRTIDAQDLIKVHDTVCEERFTDKFIQWNEALRVTRNRVIHTVDKSLEVKPEELIEYILFAFRYFSNKENWFESRVKHLNNTPTNSIRFLRELDDHQSYLTSQILREFKVSVNCLTPSKVLEYFSFQKKKNSYHCPRCYQTVSKMDHFEHDFLEDSGKTYQINEATGIYQCCICHYTGKFSSNQCVDDDCESLCVDSSSGLCVSCGSYTSP